MLKAPPNKIVVKVPHKYIRSITGLLKRASIENASTVDPSDFVNIFGEVIPQFGEIVSYFRVAICIYRLFVY